jgi:hypothetical protein
VQALDAGLGQTELLQQQVQRSGLLSSESMKDRLGKSMLDASDVLVISRLHGTTIRSVVGNRVLIAVVGNSAPHVIA